ncbi:MAG: alpha/beta fold hydrolase [Betaproteobacteria bacterium]|nr:MAG: alpha/beta fold hydrolase [Betaproteobacteria bacterium]
MSIYKKALASALFFAALAYVSICGYMFVAQRGMQYRPNTTPLNPGTALSRAPDRIPQQSTLLTRDEQKVIVWWIAPSDPMKPVFLYFHGNGANLENRAARFARLTESGAGLLAVSYRGYGGSTGAPTEAGLRIDTRTAYDELVRAKKIDPKRIIVFGESLGTTLATLLAAEVPVGGLLLDSSFDSALAVAQNAYPWLPVRWLLLDQYRADLAAPQVSAPVQQIHCRDDPVTPLALARTLNARFANAAEIHIIERRCHVPSFDEFSSVARAFATRVSARAAEGVAPK